MELQSHVRTVLILVSSLKTNYLSQVAGLILNSCIIVSAVFIQSPELYGQHKARERHPGTIQPKLVRNKPGVEIIRVSESAAASEQEKDDVSLRLSNNYGWDISICLYDDTKTSGPLKIQYRFEEIPQSIFDVDVRSSESGSRDHKRQSPRIPMGTPPIDICRVHVIKGGHSIIFSVPRSHFVLKARLRVDFYFPWEDVYESQTLREPRHSVLFYSRVLVTE